MKNIITELKNSTQSFSIRPDKLEERISRLEDGLYSGIHPISRNKKERIKKSEDSLRDLCDTIK